MATRVFYRSALSSLTIANQVVRTAALTRGSGVVTLTQASAAAAPLVLIDPTDQLVFAIQVNAFSATTGAYTWNHWGSETNAMANFTAGHGALAEVYNSAGAKRFNLITGASGWRSATEYGTSPAARTPSATEAGDARTINDGDYLVFRPEHGSNGSPASGYSLTFSYNGTSAGADGDSYMDCPDTFTEYAAPAADRVPYSTSMPQLLAQ